MFPFAAVTLFAAPAGRFGAPGLAGTGHLADPGRYLPMLPDAVPHPLPVVPFTGPCEIAGGFGLPVLRLRRPAGLLLAACLVCVFPANVKNALTGGAALDGLPAAAWYYWARLPLQALAVRWALRAAEVFAWPAPRRRRESAAPAAGA